MNDYKERFDKWQREAKEKFGEIDKQLGLKEKIEEGARAVVETAQKGAEKIKTEAEKSEVGRQAVKVAEETLKTAEESAKKAWTASEPIRDAAEDAGEKAAEALQRGGELDIAVRVLRRCGGANRIGGAPDIRRKDERGAILGERDQARLRS